MKPKNRFLFLYNEEIDDKIKRNKKKRKVVNEMSYTYFYDFENGLQRLQEEGLLKILSVRNNEEYGIYFEVLINGVTKKVKWSEERTCFVILNVPETRWFPLEIYLDKQ